MHRHFPLFIITMILVLLGAGCAKISLTEPAKNPSTTTTQQASSEFPPLTGDWTLVFQYGEQQLESTVTFSQKGNALVGQGKDTADGRPFYIQSGSANGKDVKFVKKYAVADPNMTPVTYTGVLEWVDDPEYRGWNLAGHYNTNRGQQPIEGKWVATPNNPLPPPPGVQITQQPAQPAQPADQQQPDGEQPAEGPGPNISGMYMVEYQYDFKKIQSKMWLMQDEKNVHGHGLDINTNERFTIPKGWYIYPNLTIIRQYTKGKQAAATRKMTFKAQVLPGPKFKGETNLGGSWEANLVR